MSPPPAGESRVGHPVQCKSARASLDGARTNLSWVVSKKGVPGRFFIIVSAILLIDSKDDVSLHRPAANTIIVRVQTCMGFALFAVLLADWLPRIVSG